jgi:hypothetical protein
MPKKKKIAVPVRHTARSKAAKKRAKRSRGNPEAMITATANPPLFTDLAEFVVPGFGGYAATRLLARITYTQLSKKWPKASPHVAAGSSVLAFLAAWYLLHRIDRLKKYHTPATVGAAIAALQTIVQTYLPKFGWIVSDFQPTAGSATAPKALPKPSQAQIDAASAELMDDDDDDEDIVNPLTPAMGTLTGSTLGVSDDDDGLDEFLKDMN